MVRTRLTFFALPLVLLMAACSGTDGAGEDDTDARTIAVSMTDELRFDPDEILVTPGETVRFEITNDGQAVHEFLIGDESAQDEFAEEMAANGMDHDSDAGVSVEPGQTEPFEYTFAEAGTGLLAGCHEPGHYDAGMIATFTVTE